MVKTPKDITEASKSGDIELIKYLRLNGYL